MMSKDLFFVWGATTGFRRRIRGYPNVVKLPSQRFQKPASCGIDLRVLPFRRVVARIKWSTGHTQYGVALDPGQVG